MKREDVAINFTRSDISDLDSSDRINCAMVISKYQDLAMYIQDAVPEGRHKSLAMTALEESLAWAVKSVTHQIK